MVVTPGVEGRERPALLVVRPVSHEVLPAGTRQLVDGAFEPKASEPLRLARPWPEPGAPKKPLGLGGPKRPPPHRDSGHARGHRQRSAHTGSPIEGARPARRTASMLTRRPVHGASRAASGVIGGPGVKGG